MTLLDSCVGKKRRGEGRIGSEDGLACPRRSCPCSPGLSPRTLYPVHLGWCSTPHFADASCVIAPGPHWKYWRKRGNRKMRRNEDKRADEELVDCKIKAKIFIVNVACRYIFVRE